MDQAEELLSRSDQAEVVLLTTALDTIVADRRAWLLYTLRSDFLTDLLRSVTAGRLVGESVLIPALRPEELSAAIVRPARLLGWEYQPEAVAEMIADTAGSHSLPLLAYALDRLFRQVSAEDRGNRLITLADYTSSGRVRDVLTAQADIAFEDAIGRAAEQLPVPTGDSRSAAERRVLQLLRRLVSIQDGIPVRRTVALHSVDPADRTVLEPFVAKRVVSLTEQNTAEVTHEALLTHWPRLSKELNELREALQARAEIERRAAEWAEVQLMAASGTADDILLPVTRLLAFLDVVRRGADLEPTEEPSADGWPALRASLAALDLGEREIEYVDRSLQGALRDEVARISRDLDTDPVRATGELLGWRSNLQHAVMSMLVNAPDTGPMVELVHRTMAANPVHLLVEAHLNGAWGAAWAPDGTRFVTGGRDQAVRVWRLVDHGMQPANEMRHGMDAVSQPPLPGWVRNVAWTGDGRHILSVATDENLKIWDAETGGEIRSHGHPDRLWTVHTPNAGGPAATAGADGLVRLYPIDRRSREPVVTVPVGGGRLWAAALSPDATRVAAACEDCCAYVFSVDDPMTARLRLPHPDKVRSITWNPGGSLLGTGCQDGVGRVFDATTGELCHELTGHTDQIRTIGWSPSGLRIATGSADLDIRVWDAATGLPVAVLHQHGQGICALDWAPAGDRLLSAADDGTARVWKVGSEPTVCIALDGAVRAIAWHAARGVLAVALAENKRIGPSQVVLVSGDGTVEAKPVARHPMPVLSLVWAGDGDLITGSVDQTAVRWRGGRAVATYTGARDTVVMAIPSPSGDQVLGVARDRVIRLWENDGRLRFDDEPEWHQSFITDADWDATGQRFAVVSDDHQLSVHQVEDRHHTMTNTGLGLTSVAWNDVTDEIAVGRVDGAVLIYDCADGIQPHFRRQLLAHTQAITDLSWSLDGSLLCAASEDSQASIWDCHSGIKRTILVGHTAPITACVWTAYREVATGGEDGRIRFWNVHDADLHPTAGLSAVDGIDPKSPGYLRRILDELGHRAGGRAEAE